MYGILKALSNSRPGVKVQVQVILQPTVSRSVHLGVVPLLERVTRCYISLSDNYFLSFSCRATSLTRGRGCNLQCNDAIVNKLFSHITFLCDHKMMHLLSCSCSDHTNSSRRVTERKWRRDHLFLQHVRNIYGSMTICWQISTPSQSCNLGMR
jgi:hypothetical protein